MRSIALNLIAGLTVIAAGAYAASIIQARTEESVGAARQKFAMAKAVSQRYMLYGDLSLDLQRLEPVLPALYSAIPGPEDVFIFSNAIELLARETGNTVTLQFSAQEPVQDPGFPDIRAANFDATLNGTRDTFEKFIDGFDKLRPIGMISSLAIDGGQGIEGTAQMTVKGAAFITKK